MFYEVRKRVSYFFCESDGRRKKRVCKYICYIVKIEVVSHCFVLRSLHAGLVGWFCTDVRGSLQDKSKWLCFRGFSCSATSTSTLHFFPRWYPIKQLRAVGDETGRFTVGRMCYVQILPWLFWFHSQNLRHQTNYNEPLAHWWLLWQKRLCKFYIE